MSYDIHILDADGAVVQLDKPHRITGGTYQVGGTTEAWINITCNYAAIFETALGAGGIRALDGMRIAYVKVRLREAIRFLVDSCNDDYWNPIEPMEGNARRALVALFTLCELVDADTCTLRVRC